jgi:hypothetical protein
MDQHRVDAIPAMALFAEELFFGEGLRYNQVTMIRPVVVIVEVFEILL